MIEFKKGCEYKILKPVKLMAGKGWDDMRVQSEKLGSDKIRDLVCELPAGSVIKVLEKELRPSQVAFQLKVRCQDREGWINSIALINAVEEVGS